MPKKEKADLQNQQAGIDITMAEKYLDEAAVKTLDIANKKTLFDLFVRKIEVKQGNLSVDFKIKIYYDGSANGNRTRDFALRGRRLSLLTIAP